MVRLAWLVMLLALPAWAADAGAKPRIAALYYRDLANNPDLASFAKGLAAMLINDLGETGSFTTLERERVDELLKEKQLGSTDYADKSSFGKLAAVLGAEYLITGEIVQMGKNKYFLISKLIRADTFEIVGTGRVPLDPDDVMTAVEKITELATTKLRALGSLGTAAPVQKAQRDYKVPLSTAVKYARALDAKDKKDTATATKLLTEVTTEQPALKVAKLDLLSLTR